MRAYGHSAKEGLLAAGIAELVLYRKYSVLAAYPDSGKVQYEILQDGHELFDTIYTEQVEFIVLVETDAADSFENDGNLPRRTAVYASGGGLRRLAGGGAFFAV